MPRHSTALQWQENQLVIRKQYFNNIMDDIISGIKGNNISAPPNMFKDSIKARIANVRLFDNGIMKGNAIINKRGDKIPVEFTPLQHIRKVYNKDTQQFEEIAVRDLSNGFWREV